MDKQGTTVRQYSGRNIQALMDAIALDAPAMRPDHALYLGVMLERAWNALRYGEKFIQG